MLFSNSPSSPSDSASQLRSLFLPSKPEDRVAFAALCSLLHAPLKPCGGVTNPAQDQSRGLSASTESESESSSSSYAQSSQSRATLSGSAAAGHRNTNSLRSSSHSSSSSSSSTLSRSAYPHAHGVHGIRYDGSSPLDIIEAQDHSPRHSSSSSYSYSYSSSYSASSSAPPSPMATRNANGNTIKAASASGRRNAAAPVERPPPNNSSSSRSSQPTSSSNTIETEDVRDEEASNLLFSVLYQRPTCLLALLHSREVVLYDLRDTAGPREVRRIRPMPVISAAQSRNPTRRTNNGVVQPMPTCFSLIPPDLAFLCRSTQRSTHSSTRSGSRSRSRSRSRRFSDATAEEEDQEDERNQGQSSAFLSKTEKLLLGVVGTDDGRVSVFSEVSYAFSFAAHQSPVVEAHAIYYPRPSHGIHPHASSAGPSSSAMKSSAGSVRSTSVRGAGGNIQPQGLAAFGLVTRGQDGAVFLWHKVGGVFKPHRLLGERPLFARGAAFHVYRPPVAAAASGALLCGAYQPLFPPAALFYATTETLSVFSLQEEREEGAASSSSSRRTAIQTRLYDLPPAARLFGGGGGGGGYEYATLFTNEGGTTALSTNGVFTLLARDLDIYRIDCEAGAVPKCILHTARSVTAIAQGDQLAVLSARRESVVWLVRPTSPKAVLLCEYYGYQHRPLRQVGLHEEEGLLLLVDHVGDVELVALPRLYTATEVLRCTHRLAAALPSVALLKARCALDDAMARDRAGQQAAKAERDVFASVVYASTHAPSSSSRAGRVMRRLPAPVRTVLSKLLRGREALRVSQEQRRRSLATTGTGSSLPISLTMASINQAGAAVASLPRCREALLLARMAAPPEERLTAAQLHELMHQEKAEAAELQKTPPEIGSEKVEGEKEVDEDVAP